MAESTQTLAEDSGAQPGGDAEEYDVRASRCRHADGPRPKARPEVLDQSAPGACFVSRSERFQLAEPRAWVVRERSHFNERSLEEFFPNKVHQQLISEPFVTLGAEGQFDVAARITGGGVTGQAGALRLGIARALTLVDPENRVTLKRAGFLTRDARVKERKKYGLKKARKAPQYSKR